MTWYSSQYCEFLQCLLSGVKKPPCESRLRVTLWILAKFAENSPEWKSHLANHVSPLRLLLVPGDKRRQTHCSCVPQRPRRVLDSSQVRLHSEFYQTTLQDSAKLETVGQIVCSSFFWAVKNKGREKTAGLDSKEICFKIWQKTVLGDG